MIREPIGRFLRGEMITIKAIRYPISAEGQEMLVSAAVEVTKTRTAMEHIMAGASKQKDDATDAYKAAVANLESVENMIRRNLGVEYSRPEFLSVAP